MKSFKIDKKWEWIKINYNYFILSNGIKWHSYNSNFELWMTIWFPILNNFDRFNPRRYCGDIIITKTKYTHNNEKI